MTGLPRGLSRWRDQLAIFPSEVGQLLGALLARLAPAFDATARAGSFSSGEPDGFEGLSRRGSFERLLPAEWMLARAVPLEFLRRAADSELAFFELSQRRPAAPPGTVVLFDAGPDQLGASRLAQLAILVLLAERAERAKSAFGWQLLHHQGDPLHSTLNEASVRAFLSGRTALRTGPRAVESWAARFAKDELWLVGSRRTVRAFRERARTVEIRERVALDDRLLDVAVARPRARGRAVALELPDDATAVRALRDPFETKRPPRVSPGSLASNLLLSPSGNRLYYRSAAGDLVAWSVPSHASRTLEGPRRYPARPRMKAAAIGRSGRTIVWLSLDEHRAVVSSTRAIRRDVRSTVLECALPPCPEPSELGPLIVFTTPLGVVFVAPDRRLYRLSFSDVRSGLDTSPRCELLAEGARSLIPLRQGDRGGALCAVDSLVSAGGRPAVALITSTGALESPFTAYAGSAVFLRTFSNAEHEMIISVGEREDGTFRIERAILSVQGVLYMQGATILHAPSRATVVGVDVAGRDAEDVGLILLERDGKKLSMVGRQRSSTLVRSDSKIQNLAFASASTRFACTNEGGELIAGERNGTILCRAKAEVT